MHSQDRILHLSVTRRGLSDSFLQKSITLILFVIFSAQINFGQCPPDTPDTEAPACGDPVTLTLNLPDGVCALETIIPVSAIPTPGMDNCDPLPSISIASQPSSTKPLGLGPHEITYQITDASFNSVSCTYTLIIDQASPGSLNCTGTINHSLNPMTCTGTLTIEDVIGTNDVSCAEACEVTIMDEYGSPIPNELTLDHIGEKLQYQLCCGGVCCWGYLNVQYYGIPTFDCPATPTVISSSCIEMNEIDPPLAVSQCLPPSVVLISQIENVVNCPANVQKEIIRTYQIVTPQGPTSETCEQRIEIIAANLDNIIWPNKATIGCEEDADVALTGAPSYYTGTATNPIDTFSLAPGEFPLDCSVFVSYEDTEFNTNCGKLISRQWRVVQWACGVEDQRNFLQTIDVGDVNPPAVNCPTGMLEFTTTTLNCMAAVSIPPIQATDDCATELEYRISTPGGVIRNNGGVVVLPIGMYDIVYRVSDCQNETACTVAVEVKDLTPPVAICESDLKIGFGEVGNTFLQAYKLDGGSYDDCDTVTYLIARMDDTLRIDEHPYADKILIECSDVDTSFMAILQTMDKSGNVSYCMVSVCVQDNREPNLMCPPTATVACDTIFDETKLSLFFGDYSIVDNCPDRFTVRDFLTGDRNECGTGELTRKIRIFNREGDRIDLCDQRIIFEQSDELTIAEIEAICPKPIGPLEMCDFPTDLDEEVEFESKSCQILGFNMTLDTLTPAEIDAAGLLSCMAIERCWKFIDWCKEEGVFSKLEPYVKCDTVQLVDVIEPDILGLPMNDETICFFSQSCEDEANILLDSPRVATDCSGIDSTGYTIFDVNNGIVTSGGGLQIDVNLTAGEYVIRWYAEDNCGNIRTRHRRVFVENCKGPTLSCSAGIVVPLFPSSNGVPIAMVETKQLVAAAFHSCGYDVVTSFFETNFTSTQIQTTKTFTCNNIGEPVELEIYAIDENDRVSHCTTFVSVSDNNLCPQMPASGMFTVGGEISTMRGRYISDVEVMLDGDTKDRRFTNANGSYSFGTMPSGGDYIVHARKSQEFLKGVSMTDLILIQQHIIGVKTMTDPYLLLAADVNHSGAVSIADLIMLQRMLLGTQTIPNLDEGWIFVDESYVFLDPDSPFGNDMPTAFDIESLHQDMDLNFIGIKLGDIDGSGMENLAKAEKRTTEIHEFSTQNVWLEKGHQYKIPIYTDKLEDLKGLDLSLSFKGADVIDIQSVQLDVENSVHISSEGLRLLMPVAEGVSLTKLDPLFYVILDATRSARLTDVIQLENKERMSQLWHSEDLQSKYIDLSISRNHTDIEIQVQPNPWSNLTRVEFSSESGSSTEIYITNTSGQMIFRKRQQLDNSKNFIELTDHIIPHPGVYFIHIDNGNTTATEKMIKLE